jgi:hypothetical protein
VKVTAPDGATPFGVPVTVAVYVICPPKVKVEVEPVTTTVGVPTFTTVAVNELTVDTEL